MHAWMDGWIDGQTDGCTSLSGTAILAGSRQSQFLQRLPGCVETRADAGHLEDFHLITQSSLGPHLLHLDPYKPNSTPLKAQTQSNPTTDLHADRSRHRMTSSRAFLDLARRALHGSACQAFCHGTPALIDGHVLGDYYERKAKIHPGTT